MRYREPVYRPPSEAFSLLIQATYGCPWNRCTFCGMYKGSRYQVRTVNEIKADLDEAHRQVGDQVRTLFFPDGNTIAMPVLRLAEICRHAHATFPQLERITVYGSAKFVLNRTPEELAELQQAGLGRIHMGMETGHGPTLERVRKGVTPEQIIEAGRRVVAAGIELSEYYLVGLAGVELAAEHAAASAEVLNAIGPDFLRLRTLHPIPGTPLYEEAARGELELPGPHEAMREVRVLIESLDTTTQVLSDHVSNYADVAGQLPADKDRMLELIDRALAVAEDSLRPRYISPGL